MHYARGDVMSAYLKQQIQDRMDERNLSIYALEKKAGLNRSAVRNILQGFSKNPSVEILSAIAIALDCTLNELVDPEQIVKTSQKITARTASKNKESVMWNENLYLDTAKVISKIAEEKNLSLNLDQMNSFILEAYKYSIDKSSKSADKDFCKWLMGRA
jgi:transcriptional regulator with XRE-family HTH domain